MIFTIVWLLGTLASLAFFGYMKGHADTSGQATRERKKELTTELIKENA